MSLHYLGKHEPGNCIFSVRHRHVSSPGECGWLWTEPISYSKCSKWRPLAFPHARSHPCINLILPETRVIGLYFCRWQYGSIFIKLLWWALKYARVLKQTASYTVSQKNDTDVTHYRFNPHQPILVIFGRDVAEIVCYWMVIYYPTSPN